MLISINSFVKITITIKRPARFARLTSERSPISGELRAPELGKSSEGRRASSANWIPMRKDNNEELQKCLQFWDDLDDDNGRRAVNRFLIMSLTVAAATLLDSSDENQFTKWTSIIRKC